MKHFKKATLYLHVVFLIALTYCSKSTTEPTETGSFSPTIPAKSLIEFTFPVDAPDQVNALLNQTVSGLNYIFLFIEVLKDESPEITTTSFTWHGRSNTLDVKLQALQTDPDSIYWEFRLDSGGYDNWLNFSGQTTLNNKSGIWKVFNYGLNSVLMASSWLRDESNQLTITNYVPYNLRTFNLTVDTDGNTSLVVIGSNVRVFEANWDVSGHGSWISYAYPSGQKSGNGLW